MSLLNYVYGADTEDVVPHDHDYANAHAHAYPFVMHMSVLLDRIFLTLNKNQ